MKWQGMLKKLKLLFDKDQCELVDIEYARRMASFETTNHIKAQSRGFHARDWRCNDKQQEVLRASKAWT